MSAQVSETTEQVHIYGLEDVECRTARVRGLSSDRWGELGIPMMRVRAEQSWAPNKDKVSDIQVALDLAHIPHRYHKTGWPPAKADEAERLVTVVANKWQSFLVDVAPDIIECHKKRVWTALGYPSWQALCVARFEGVRLPAPVRAEIATEMRDSGMSQRAIGHALSVDESTVRADLGTRRVREIPHFSSGAVRDQDSSRTYEPVVEPTSVSEPDVPWYNRDPADDPVESDDPLDILDSLIVAQEQATPLYDDPLAAEFRRRCTEPGFSMTTQTMRTIRSILTARIAMREDTGSRDR